ncbi:MAG: ABC transporter ATP-binding protein, partial [Armatimonadetes bacterium]|nr:ABC transporter ATP-binding protein [Armatimonadota bacterium]
MNKFRRLMPYALKEWPTLISILGMTLLSSLVGALQPWPMKLLVDYALGDTDLPHQFQVALRLFSIQESPVGLIAMSAFFSLGLFALNSIFDISLSWAWTAAGQRMVWDLAGDMFDRLQRFTPSYHTQRSTGDTLSRVTGDSWCVYSVTDNILITPGQCILQIVMISGIAFKLEPQLALILIGMAPLLVVSARFFGSQIKTRSRLNREAQSRLMSLIHQSLSSVRLIQAFGTADRNRHHFRDLSKGAVTVSQRGALISSSYKLVNNLTSTAGMALVLYLGGLKVLSGAITVGSLLVLLAYLRNLQYNFQNLMNTYGKLKGFEASIDRVLEVLDAPKGVEEREGARRLTRPA